ncbi:Signal transduction histidine kinase regulating C4-dicarboxylate transport system [uncultured Pleomorphomonas sp.]|uniref:C4-dicarboxylate transport sensor protein DctB n=1 Tax=uncultured Pleomorphomonas sp. TaxID=442121 RepID=A0A212LBU0_9HYPH|nr:ATP-binding protein [uncultured Pleomorphomonas sp.]SCM75005.1 Signal transduction histidine kinase regulating C4-dicarboxylate transport system [uncultured Pleomorphomonas sp.]
MAEEAESIAPKRRWLRLAAVLPLAGALAIAAVVALVTYRVAFELSLSTTRASAGHRLDLYAASFEREVGQYANYPYVMALDGTVLALLDSPTDSARRRAADSYLEALNDRIGTLDAYLLDKTGRVIASSNWNKWDSFVGRDLSYRPYYQNAGVGRVSRFYGIGTTNLQPGYFLATAIARGNDTLGIGVVKVSLDQLERSWASAESPAILSDEHGVVVQSSVPAWKYGTLRPLDAAARRQIAEAQQYNDRALAPIGLSTLRELDDRTHIVRLPGTAGSDGSFSTEGLFLAESRAMPDTPWTLTVFTDLSEMDDLARLWAALAGLGSLLCLGLLAVWRQRRRHLGEILAARAALQQAHDHLESEVADRTAALSATNERLRREVEERERTERTLRDAQSGLVQAGKLASLGQLSAGIAHELNQPLAALVTLSGNAVRFLDRGDLDTVRGNLERVRPLVERMGHLTGELKTFARKSSGEPQRVGLRKVIDDVLFLLNHRLTRGRVAMTIDIDGGDIDLWCDANRFEQVLLNLIGNAVDAMEGGDDQRIILSARREGRFVRIDIRDNGPGLPPERLDHMFEPFFTTKAPGVGLGLGLTISAGIIRDFGGELVASNAEGGGAVFSMTIPTGGGEAT